MIQMHQKNTFFLMLFLFWMVIILPIAAFGQSETSSDDIAPNQDAYVKFYSPDENAGLGDDLIISDTNAALMEFSLSSIPSNTEKVTFSARLGISGDTYSILRIFWFNNTIWDEKEVTWNNFNADLFGIRADPDLEGNLTEIEVIPSMETLEFDIIKDIWSQNEKITLLFIGDLDMELFLILDSIEEKYATNPPHLELDVPVEPNSMSFEVFILLIVVIVVFIVGVIYYSQKKAKKYDAPRYDPNYGRNYYTPNNIPPTNLPLNLRLCPQCGSQIPSNSIFCNKCGFRL